MDNSKMFLYWGSGSGPCWKPMISLAEKGLWEGCPNKMVSFSKKEHKTDEIITLNPRGQVPTFRDGDVVVNESNAILMYLEENYSTDSNRLLPTSGPERAQVYQRMFEAQNVQTNIIKELVYYHWQTKPEDRDDKIIKERMEKAKVELGYWEKALNGHAYMVGNNFTLADVAVYPFLAFLMRMGASFREFPALLKYYEAITKRPSVQATWPPHWKEGTTDPILGEL
ncbi:GSTA-like protein [Mya arenaria]|uniref:GSTA-like protein n=1 Tax=Mya arenaria TaxID=6604 RepID=A0ABY7FWV2_MYAAR|nr:glutathione S-transferase A-like [Mya arenaria]WAR25321.1 GSTA-like protein [Mya arenaria]